MIERSTHICNFFSNPISPFLGINFLKPLPVLGKSGIRHPGPSSESEFERLNETMEVERVFETVVGSNIQRLKDVEQTEHDPAGRRRRGRVNLFGHEGGVDRRVRKCFK